VLRKVGVDPVVKCSAGGRRPGASEGEGGVKGGKNARVEYSVILTQRERSMSEDVRRFYVARCEREKRGMGIKNFDEFTP